MTHISPQASAHGSQIITIQLKRMLDKYFRAAYLDGQGKLTETEIKKEITLAWT